MNEVKWKFSLIIMLDRDCTIGSVTVGTQAGFFYSDPLNPLIKKINK